MTDITFTRRAHRFMSRVITASVAGLVLAGVATGPASAATETGNSGRTGSAAVADTSTNPGVTCTYRTLRQGIDRSAQLNAITLHGPAVRTIINSAADHAFVPSLISVDFRVLQLAPKQKPRLVLSSVHQTNGTFAGVTIPDKVFQTGGLPADATYVAEVAVTWKSPDQRTTFGTRTLRYDFYRTVLDRSASGPVKSACR